MKALAYLFILAMLPHGLWAEAAPDIPPPKKRAAAVDLARTLLATKPIDSAEEELAGMNPFNPVQPVTESVDSVNTTVAISPTLSGRDLLENISETVTPSGMMQLGDRQILVFGQKKFKVGDHIPVVYQGSTYELEVSAIDRTSFTLRLKNEEITRPIKAPVKKP